MSLTLTASFGLHSPDRGFIIRGGSVLCLPCCLEATSEIAGFNLNAKPLPKASSTRKTSSASARTHLQHSITTYKSTVKMPSMLGKKFPVPISTLDGMQKPARGAETDILTVKPMWPFYAAGTPTPPPINLDGPLYLE